LTTPTATQVREVGHETLAKEFNPAGGVCGLQFFPSAVASIPIPPTAVHSSIVKHEIDWAGNVESSMLHVEPPSLDFMMPSPPPA
jgi:hypothetical protein